MKESKNVRERQRTGVSVCTHGAAEKERSGVIRTPAREREREREGERERKKEPEREREAAHRRVLMHPRRRLERALRRHQHPRLPAEVRVPREAVHVPPVRCILIQALEFGVWGSRTQRFDAVAEIPT